MPPQAELAITAVPPPRSRPFALRWSRARVAAFTLVALLGLAVALFDWNWLRPALQHQLSTRAQRSVQIADLNVRFGSDGSPIVRLRSVQVENAPWADTRQPMVRAGEVEFVFDWRSLVARRPSVTRLVLQDADVDLERQADGLRNWRLTQPADRGPARFHVLAVEAHRSRLRFAHRGLDLDLTLATRPAPEPVDPRLPALMELRGRLSGTAFSGRLLTGPVITLQRTGVPFALRGEAANGASRLVVDGTLTDLLHLSGADLDVQLSGPSLDAWRHFAPWALPASQPYRADAHLKKHDGEIDLTRLHARVGGSDAGGELHHRRDGNGRPSLQATLASATLAWADLLPPRRTGPRPGPAGGDAPASAWPGSPLNLDGLDDIDLQVDWRAQRFLLSPSPAAPVLQGLSLGARLARGVLALAPLQAGLGGGRLDGRFTLDSRPQRPAVQAELRLTGVRIERLWPHLPEPHRVEGGLDGELRLTGQGDSVAAWMASAAGTARLTLAGGQIANRLDAELGLNGGKLLRSLLSGPALIALDCGAADIDVRDGQGQLRRFALDTARTHLDGQGSFDLRAARLDLLLLPHARERSLLVLPSALRVQGPWLKPAVALAGRPQGVAASSCAAR